MLPVAILAGGLATRLHPLTISKPKALLNVAGRPFIFHQLEFLRSQCIDRVVLCVGHHGEQIRAAVGDGGAPGLNVYYSFDGDNLLGTGGALRKALPLLGKSFIVLNGDSYTPCCLASMQTAFHSARRPALMAVLRNDHRWDRSNILFRNGELIEYQKDAERSDMSHIDFGVSVLSSRVFSTFESSAVIDMATIYRRLSLERQLAAFEVAERFYEIGSRQGLLDTENFLSARMTLA